MPIQADRTLTASTIGRLAERSIISGHRTRPRMGNLTLEQDSTQQSNLQCQ